MHFAIIFRVLGLLLMLFSLTLMPPFIVSIIYRDGTHIAFILSFIIIFVIGLSAWSPVYKSSQDLRTRDGFVIAASYWPVLSIASPLPLILAACTD